MAEGNIVQPNDSALISENVTFPGNAGPVKAYLSDLKLSSALIRTERRKANGGRKHRSAERFGFDFRERDLSRKRRSGQSVSLAPERRQKSRHGHRHS